MTGPVRWTKRPVTVEAMLYDGTNADEVRRWQYRHVQQVGHPSVWFKAADEAPVIMPEGADAAVYDYLHQTWVGVSIGQWVIRGVKGEFYPCDPEVLADTYVPAELEQVCEHGGSAHARTAGCP